MNRKKKLILIAVAMLLIAAIVTGVILNARKKSQAPAAGARGKQAVPVLTAIVQSGDLSSVNTLTGTIAANLQTNVGSKIAGNVRSVNAEMGQIVHTGQVLAQLDPSDLQKQLAQLQAQIQVDEAQLPIVQNNADQSKADYQRNEALFSSNAISKQALEQSRLKMQNDQAQVQVTQAMLNKDQAAAAVTEQQIREMTITSPVDGVVATKNIEVGEQISTQTILFNIAQVDPVKLTVNVSDQIIAGIQPGTAAKITVAQLGANPFQGSVIRVSPVLDSTSHAYPVEIQIANPDRLMTPGMAASVQFSGLKTQPGIVIPAQAVLETTQGSEVFTVENNVAHMHIVQLGAVSSDKVVITSGLKPGDQIVVQGQGLLADGASVTVVQDPEQAGDKGLINQIKKGADK